MAAGYARDLWIDGGKARRELDWQPRHGDAAAVLKRLARARAGSAERPDPPYSPKASSAKTP